jgi:hypothetical protein
MPRTGHSADVPRRTAHGALCYVLVPHSARASFQMTACPTRTVAGTRISALLAALLEQMLYHAIKKQIALQFLCLLT